jgi:hypothetical protein
MRDTIRRIAAEEGIDLQERAVTVPILALNQSHPPPPLPPSSESGRPGLDYRFCQSLRGRPPQRLIFVRRGVPHPPFMIFHSPSLSVGGARINYLFQDVFGATLERIDPLLGLDASGPATPQSCLTSPPLPPRRNCDDAPQRCGGENDPFSARGCVRVVGQAPRRGAEGPLPPTCGPRLRRAPSSCTGRPHSREGGGGALIHPLPH